MLPEERELSRLEGEQAALQEQVAAIELEFETVKADTIRFMSRYFQRIRRLYVRLDELNVQIATARMKFAPNVSVLRARADAAKEQAKKSAEEAGLRQLNHSPAPHATPELKRAYRRAAKLIHPDLAVSERERQRRTKLIALVNLAYERGDQKCIEKLIEEFGEDPEAIFGEDVGSRIIKTIRRLAQLRRRLSDLRAEIVASHRTKSYELRKAIEAADSAGDNPLADLASQLAREIVERETELEAIRKRPRV